MDSKKAGQLLERINALHRSLHALGGEADISAIERDLMLSYLRQLYAAYLDVDAPTSQPTARPVRPAPKPAPAPKAVEEKPVPPPPEPEPPVVKTPPTPPPPPKPVVAPPPPPVKTASPKIEKLFVQPKAKELSERLSQQPVKDLTRALTINNRVQYTNVLFGGNNDLMNSVLQRLNAFSGMEQAKPELVELAEQFDWTGAESKEVAQDFIKLVRRRYV